MEITMRTSLFAKSAFFALTLLSPANAGNVKGVVELFTSQGCSDCPPADKTLGEFINKNGVIGLAWHVDYWDYLGWKDTFSSNIFTKRQQGYSRTLGTNSVFTPEIIVNGSTVADNGSFNNSISSALTGLPIAVNAKTSTGRVTVNVGSGSGAASLYLVTYTESRSVKIGRGENGGRDIVYRHAVTGIKNIGKWNGGAMSVTVPAGGNCAILLQQPGPGQILGAASCS
jgi:hypothetical protein